MPLKAWETAVASTSICTEGWRPARMSFSNLGGISMTNTKRCDSIDESISVASMCTAGLNVGGVRPSAMRRDRSDRSSSTTATARLSCFGRDAGGGGVDGHREGIGDQQQHDRIGAEAAQLLDHQMPDVFEVREQSAGLLGFRRLRVACSEATCCSGWAASPSIDISGLLLP